MQPAILHVTSLHPFYPSAPSCIGIGPYATLTSLLHLTELIMDTVKYLNTRFLVILFLPLGRTGLPLHRAHYWIYGGIARTRCRLLSHVCGRFRSERKIVLPLTHLTSSYFAGSTML
jgi:hypothetical protein